MNQTNNFEEKIYKYFKENDEVPFKIKKGISEIKLEKNKRRVFNFYDFRKIAVASVSLITITTGVVFAKDISKIVKNLFNDNSGVSTAIENEYVYQEPTTFSKSDNTETRITEMIMDDYTLDLNLLINFDENIDVTGITKVKIPDMIITDDNNNILYSANSEVSKEFCKEKGISTDYESIKNITTNTSSSIFIYSADKNALILTCNISASDIKFPKSKNIYLAFKTIQMEGNDKNYNVTGNWDNTIAVPTKFLNRESSMYKVTSCNNNNVYMDSIIAEVYETGTNFQMSMYWGDYGVEHAKMEEARKKSVLSSQLIKQEESYVENENGERFYPAQSSSSDGGYSFNTDGKLHKWETFTLTKFDATNKLKVVLTTINNDQIIINLKK